MLKSIYIGAATLCVTQLNIIYNHTRKKVPFILPVKNPMYLSKSYGNSAALLYEICADSILEF